MAETDKFMIHTYISRLWYVEDYLIPSMVAQGIGRNDISLVIDDGTFGCLESFFHSLKYVRGTETDATWHMQDDVIVSRDFKIKTLDAVDPEWEEGSGIVCGYCWTKDSQKHTIGRVLSTRMWWSFPCIRIPNQIGYDAADWYYASGVKNPKFKWMIDTKKYDDQLFKEYLMSKWISVYNLAPNLVDHIDYLIGGSVVNKQRAGGFGVHTMAEYFEGKDLVDKLAKELEKRGR